MCNASWFSCLPRLRRTSLTNFGRFSARQSNLLKATWPKYDPELAKEEEIEIPVQVNGKLRGKIVVAPGTGEEEIKQKALADEKVQGYVAGENKS